MKFKKIISMALLIMMIMAVLQLQGIAEDSNIYLFEYSCYNDTDVSDNVNIITVLYDNEGAAINIKTLQANLSPRETSFLSTEIMGTATMAKVFLVKENILLVEPCFVDLTNYQYNIDFYYNEVAIQEVEIENIIFNEETEMLTADVLSTSEGFAPCLVKLMQDDEMIYADCCFFTENGESEIVINMHGLEPGDYTLCVGNTTANFSYYSVHETMEALSRINMAASPAEMEQLIAEYAEVFALDLTSYNEITPKASVCVQLMEKDFRSANEFRNAFDNAVAKAASTSGSGGGEDGGETSKCIAVSNAVAKSGEDVTVSVSVEENTNMAFGTMLFNYDSTLLTPVSYTYGGITLSTSSALANLSFSENQIKASFVGAYNISAGGELLSITFHVSEEAVNDSHIAVNLESAVFGNEASDNVPLTITNGDIHILNYTLGDVNDDGTIDILDTFIILRYGVQLMSLSNSQLMAADVNLDGNVNIFDAVLIQKYDLNIITSFEPAE